MYRPTFEHLERPYFVYGTLRPAWSNSRIWETYDGISMYDGSAFVVGYQMVDHGIPYAVASGNVTDRVIGAVIVPSEDPVMREWTRMGLDQLEGHPGHYERVPVTVWTPDGEMLAWIYTPTSWVPEGRVEPTGDFANCPRFARR